MPTLFNNMLSANTRYQTTHRNATSVLDQAIVAFPKLDSNVDVVLGVLPFYHIYGTLHSLFLMLLELTNNHRRY